MQGAKTIVGVMGGGSVSPRWESKVEMLGKRIAEEGWVLLNGGRNAGVMKASARGARARGGLTVGVLPDESPGLASEYIDIPILTGLGNARNVVNVLSSRVVVACPGGSGTISEVALAVKCGRPVVLFGFDPGELFAEAEKRRMMFRESDPEAVVSRIQQLLDAGA